MMDLEKKKKELDLIKIDASIAELEYKILERMEDIKRMEEHILLQRKRKDEIAKDL